MEDGGLFRVEEGDAMLTNHALQAHLQTTCASHTSPSPSSATSAPPTTPIADSHPLSTATMSTLRRTAAPLLTRQICRQCLRSGARSYIPTTSRPQAPRPKMLAQPTLTSVPMRWHSAPAQQSTQYDFAQIKQMIEKPSADRILIGNIPPTQPSIHPPSNPPILSDQTSANPPNTPPATSRRRATSPSNPRRTPTSCPPRSSRTASASPSRARGRRWCFTAAAGCGVARRRSWRGSRGTSGSGSIGAVGWIGRGGVGRWGRGEGWMRRREGGRGVVG